MQQQKVGRMNIDTPFKIEFLTIKTNNFKEKEKACSNLKIP